MWLGRRTSFNRWRMGQARLRTPRASSRSVKFKQLILHQRKQCSHVCATTLLTLRAPHQQGQGAFAAFTGVQTRSVKILWRWWHQQQQQQRPWASLLRDQKRNFYIMRLQTFRTMSEVAGMKREATRQQMPRASRAQMYIALARFQMLQIVVRTNFTVHDVQQNALAPSLLQSVRSSAHIVTKLLHWFRKILELFVAVVCEAIVTFPLTRHGVFPRSKQLVKQARHMPCGAGASITDAQLVSAVAAILDGQGALAAVVKQQWPKFSAQARWEAPGEKDTGVLQQHICRLIYQWALASPESQHQHVVRQVRPLSCLAWRIWPCAIPHNNAWWRACPKCGWGMAVGNQAPH